MHSHQNHMDKMQIQKTIHLFELAVLDDYYEEQGPWLLSSRTVQVASRTTVNITKTDVNMGP